MSPTSFMLLLLLSVTEAVFDISKIAEKSIFTSVGSLVVFPSVSSPSSDLSVTSNVCPGLDATTSTLLKIAPVLAAAVSIL